MAGPAVTQAVADKVNAALRHEQASADAAAVQCQQDFHEQTHRKPPADVWQRYVEVTFKGPRYLGRVAADEFNCGGPHPDHDQMPFVFDLTTGSPVNWVKLFPAGVHAERERLPMAALWAQ